MPSRFAGFSLRHEVVHAQSSGFTTFKHFDYETVSNKSRKESRVRFWKSKAQWPWFGCIIDTGTTWVKSEVSQLSDFCSVEQGASPRGQCARASARSRWLANASSEWAETRREKTARRRWRIQWVALCKDGCNPSISSTDVVKGLENIERIAVRRSNLRTSRPRVEGLVSASPVDVWTSGAAMSG